MLAPSGCLEGNAAGDHIDDIYPFEQGFNEIFGYATGQRAATAAAVQPDSRARTMPETARMSARP